MCLVAMIHGMKRYRNADVKTNVIFTSAVDKRVVLATHFDRLYAGDAVKIP